jgi:hypothetical protein
MERIPISLDVHLTYRVHAFGYIGHSHQFNITGGEVSSIIPLGFTMTLLSAPGFLVLRLLPIFMEELLDILVEIMMPVKSQIHNINHMPINLIFLSRSPSVRVPPIVLRWAKEIVAVRKLMPFVLRYLAKKGWS